MAKDTGIVNIHGKDYQTVASRVQKFREKYPDYGLTTDVLERTDTDVVVKAFIYNAEGNLKATGHAEEQRQASQINRTSALENCETSAIGRALAAFGLGGTEFASADEVAQAVIHQNSISTKAFIKPTAGGQGYASDKQRAYIKKLLDMRGIAMEEQKGYIIEKFGVEMPLSVEGASFVIDELQNAGRLQTA